MNEPGKEPVLTKNERAWVEWMAKQKWVSQQLDRQVHRATIEHFRKLHAGESTDRQQ